MKKSILFISAVITTLVLSGCGGGSNYHEDEVTYHLQTYNSNTGIYEGVENVYYECGPDIVGYTNSEGAFTMVEGDYCTLFDLDETLSWEYDLLYIGLDRRGEIAVGDVRYDCDSGISDWTDYNGGFIFDPTYINNFTTGDICEFAF